MFIAYTIGHNRFAKSAIFFRNYTAVKLSYLMAVFLFVLTEHIGPAFFMLVTKAVDLNLWLILRFYVLFGAL